MNFKIAAAGLLILGLSLQSCKKETAGTVAINADSLKTDTAITATPEAMMTDTAQTVGMKSQLLNRKIMLDKEAITLNALVEGNTDKAYLLFNDDQSKAEIWMSGSPSVIFDRKGTEGNYTWTDGKHELIQWKGYVLRTLKQGTPLFGGDSM